MSVIENTTLDTHYKIIQFLKNMFPELNHERLNSRNSLYQRPGQKAIGPTIAFLAIMFIGYKIIKTKKVQKWLASRYS